MPEIVIRPLGAEYHGRLAEIWAEAVRATHHFLSEEHFNYFHARIASNYLPAVALYGAFAAGSARICLGFMGLARENDGAPLRVEMLFVHPAAHRRGIGRALLRHAKGMGGPLVLDVNEQNPGAVDFYLSQGFEIIGRSALDSGGKPYPLLHLHYKTPAMPE